jgi:AcrR family transcriptional regulator
MMHNVVDSPKNLRKRNSQQTRQTLLKAACKLFSARGFASTTMRQISEEAQVSVGLVNRYFDSKEKLFSECLREAAKGFRVIDADVFQPKTPGDGMELAKAVSQQVASSAWGQEGDLLMLLVRSSGDTGIEQLRAQAFKDMADKILKSVDQERTRERALRAQMVLAAAVGMVMLSSAKGLDPLSETTAEELVDPMQDLMSAMFVSDKSYGSDEATDVDKPERRL